METSATAAWSTGQSAWPGVPLANAALTEFLRERGVEPAELTAEQATDWYILCAVVRGEPGAARALIEATTTALDEALRRVTTGAEQSAEVRQRLWSDLLTAAPGHGLTSWQGRGRLLAFLKVSAVRLALKERRSDRRLVAGDDELFAQQTTGLTPELSFLRESYRAAFREAFQRALDSLPSRDQLLLRQHTLDGLSLEQLAAQHQVHRATVARWLASARETLVLRSRRHFFAAIELPPGEGDSVLRLVESRLDETIRRRLQSAG